MASLVQQSGTTIFDLPSVIYTTKILTCLPPSDIFNTFLISKQINIELFDDNLLKMEYQIQFQTFFEALNVTFNEETLPLFLRKINFLLKIYENLINYRKTIFKRKAEVFLVDNCSTIFQAKNINDYMGIQKVNQSSWSFGGKKIFHVAGHQFNPLNCIVLNDGSLFIREPKRIVHPMPKFFYGITLKSSVSKISVGCKHTVCNTLNGMGFVWGENTEGKLGLGESATGYVSKPTLLNIKEFQFESTFFVTCSAGESHTCLVDTNGIVYASGYGEGGRLGNNTCRNQNMFQKMSFRTRNCFSLSHDETKLFSTRTAPKIITVECGRSWTLLIASDGIPYGTGQNRNLQMGYSFGKEKELLSGQRINWSSPKAILFTNEHNKEFTNGMKNIFIKCKFVRAGYLQNASYFIDYDNVLYATPHYKTTLYKKGINETLWNKLNIRTKYDEILDADVDSCVLKFLVNNKNGPSSYYYYDLWKNKRVTTEKILEDRKVDFKKHLYIDPTRTKKTLSASKSVNVHNKNKNIVTLKMMNIISNENITFDNINPNTVLKTIDTMKDSKKIMALPESKSYHPNLTAYVLDNVFCEETCKKIDQLRNKIELDLKRPTCARRFFKEWIGTQTQQTRHSENGWVGQAFEAMFKSLKLPFHTMPWFRYLEYAEGGCMAKHSDGSNTHIVNNTLIRSTHTLLYYLNDCEDGGETTLFKKKISKKKKKKKKKTKHVDDNLSNAFINKMNIQDNNKDEEDEDDYEKSILDVVKAKRNRLLIFPHSCEHEGNLVGNDAKIALRAEIYMYGEQYGCKNANNISWYETTDYVEYKNMMQQGLKK